MSQTQPESRAFASVPALLRRNAANFADSPAYREKEFGIWIAYDWAAVEDHVSAMAAGFANLGLGAGDVVALIGDNRPEWVWGEVAAHACRAGRGP